MKNLLGALTRSMVFFAGIHLVILAVISLRDGTVSYLNIFNILEIQDFIPEFLTTSPLGDIISTLVMLTVFIFFLLIRRKV